jgi:hypothetical protein
MNLGLQDEIQSPHSGANEDMSFGYDFVLIDT